MKYLPDNPYEYLVYQSKELLEIGRRDLKNLLFNNKLESISSSTGTRQLVSLEQLSLKQVSNLIGVPANAFNEVKLEILTPYPSGEKDYLKLVRFKDILPSIKFEGDINDTWGTSLYHTDFSFPYNNYKLIVYLNDVGKDCGATVVSDPPIFPTKINGSQSLFENQSKINAADITFKELTGKAGTCVVMNSHLVHRASFPKAPNYRLAMHLGFTLEGKQYHHRNYNKEEFYAKK